MSTHNICFYRQLEKIIIWLSQNTLLICSSGCVTDYCPLQVNIMNSRLVTWPALICPHPHPGPISPPQYLLNPVLGSVVCCSDQYPLEVKQQGHELPPGHMTSSDLSPSPPRPNFHHHSTYWTLSWAVWCVALISILLRSNNRVMNSRLVTWPALICFPVPSSRYQFVSTSSTDFLFSVSSRM